MGSRAPLRGFVGLLGALVALVNPATGFAETRTEFLANQLRTSDDFRIRTQAALALGATGDPGAVAPLCGGLIDGSEVVRVAAAAALGKLSQPQGESCLQARLGVETQANVKSQIEKSLRALATNANSGSKGEMKVYVALGSTNNKTDRSASDMDALVRRAMTNKLGSFSGYVVAPKGESPAAAKKVLATRPVKAFYLQTTIEAPVYQGDRLTVVVRVVMSTYPGKDLKGEFAPKLTQTGASKNDKASEDELIQMALERALDSFEKVVATSM